MELDSLTDGASRQLLALYDGDVREFITILCLPLVDGVFATLLVSGAIETFSDVLSISLTIFAGAGALAVLYSSAETKAEAKSMVLKSVPVLMVGAFIVSLVAPVFDSLFYMSRMKTVAGLALFSIALSMLNVRKAEVLSVPAIIITGIALSIKNPGAMSLSLQYVVPGLLTALAASLALYMASFLDRESLDLDYIRNGGGLVLMIISASQLGIEVPSNLGIGVFAVSILLSYKPISQRKVLGSESLLS